MELADCRSEWRSKRELYSRLPADEYSEHRHIILLDQIRNVAIYNPNTERVTSLDFRTGRLPNASPIAIYSE